MFDTVMYYLPFILIGFRTLLGIAILVNIKNKSFSPLYLPMFIIGSATDMLDGIICRAYGASHYPALLSGLDSYADMIFILSVVFYLLINYKDVLKKHSILFVILIITQICSWLFSVYKFSSITNYHPYSAKIWGVLIGLTIIEICIRKKSHVVFAMFLAGMLCLVEEMSITYILPVKKTNIPTIMTAIQVADEYRTNKNRQK
jgi:phosphatidylglycerophosphate synthase